MDLETAIADFLALGRSLQAAPALTGEHALDQLMAWYRAARVDGAALEQEDDMLLLQWGATRPMLFSEPTDLRQAAYDDLRFAEQPVQYLDFTRQVLSADANGDGDFDDSAVQMSITLGFDLADGGEPSSHIWVHTPSGLDEGRAELLGVPFVKALLGVAPRSISITVGFCG